MIHNNITSINILLLGTKLFMECRTTGMSYYIFMNFDRTKYLRIIIKNN